MAPAPTYASPQVQLGRLMVAARRRGVSFEAWWAEAVRDGQSLVMTNHRAPPAGCVRWPTDRNDRVTWQFAIKATKEGWRRSYERIEPTPSERAVAMLGDSIDALQTVAALRQQAELDCMPAQAALPSAA